MTKKNLSELRPLAALLWILIPALGTACGFFASKAMSYAAMVNVTGIDADNYDEWDPGIWGVFFEGEHTQADLISKYITFAVLFGIAMIMGVIALMIMSGHFTPYENDRPALNWFDKIWTELHIACLAGASCGAVFLMYPLYELWPVVSGSEGFEPGNPDEYWYGPTNKLVIGLCLLGCCICLLAAVICLVTLTKKLKAHKFFRGSLIGIALITIWHGISYVIHSIFRSGKYQRKYILIGIGMVLLAMTWIGAVVDLVLILLLVPKFVKKYRAIQDGVSEVKSGNLTYKIPIEYDNKGPVTSLDSLAENINEISQATNAAVQNELKNQRLKTDLISNVSHDLKTPLTSMITYVDLLKTEGLDSESAPEYLDIIDEKTHRLKNLTENLFEAAKASSGNIPCEITDVDISTIVNQALAEMEDRLAERDLNVIVKNELDDSMVRADGQLLWRVIENLLSNVSKYAQEGSRVYINLGNSTSYPTGKGHVLLEVKNMSQDALNIPADELMERFKRGDESRNTEGSGLGLAIAKDLTHLMGGVFEITIDGDLFKASVMLEKA